MNIVTYILSLGKGFEKDEPSDIQVMDRYQGKTSTGGKSYQLPD